MRLSVRILPAIGRRMGELTSFSWFRPFFFRSVPLVFAPSSKEKKPQALGEAQ